MYCVLRQIMRSNEKLPRCKKSKPDEKKDTILPVSSSYRCNLTMELLWLPPVFTFVFVLSFELGRRKRQKSHQRLTMSAVRVVDDEFAWSSDACEPIQCWHH
mmetsp:Transcript_20846/g.51170  ORF Transcript_20846/g.51170 Transcript_20846/m.51170 type:complete len:102 (-) Transcript_20846:222-527(-)